MNISDIAAVYYGFGPLILRVALGAAFMAHGYPKLFKSPGMVAGWLDSIGIRPGRFWAIIVGATEFFGGLALIFGVFTELSALLIAICMVVAMVKVKWGNARYIEQAQAGWELDMIYFAAAVALILLGPGSYALGDLFWGR